nr:hypothetical protein [Dyella sp. ASV24]
MRAKLDKKGIDVTADDSTHTGALQQGLHGHLAITQYFLNGQREMAITQRRYRRATELEAMKTCLPDRSARPRTG